MERLRQGAAEDCGARRRGIKRVIHPTDADAAALSHGRSRSLVAWEEGDSGIPSLPPPPPPPPTTMIAAFPLRPENDKGNMRQLFFLKFNEKGREGTSLAQVLF